MVAINIGAIQAQYVKMDIQVESRAEALDQRHCPGRTFPERVSSLVDKMSGNGPLNDAQHLAHRLGMGGKQVSQGKGETDDPLTKRRIGEHFIGQ